MTTDTLSDPKDKVISTTKEDFSQTDFPEDCEQEVVLGQYLESKLGQDLDNLKVTLLKQTCVMNYQAFPPDIVIVEFPEQEEEEII